MSNVSVKRTEKDLFSYFQFVRLETSKQLNDLNIEKNKKVEEEKTTAKGLFGNIKKAVNRTIHSYDKKDTAIDDDLKAFNEKNTSVIDKDTAISLVNSIFQEDKYGLAKLIFSSSIILDDEYKYKYVEDGLKEVSEILFNNKFELLTIKTQLEKNYNAIAPKSLSSTQKGLLFGAAVLSFVGFVCMPIGLAGSATSTALATHGFASVGAITLNAAFASAVITGITYGGMKLYNREEVKKEFLSLSPEANSLYLAIQCTYIERIMKQLEETDFKEQLDMILRNLNLLKSDLDYYLFVEKQSTKDNLDKEKSFHTFDERLGKVMGF